MPRDGIHLAVYISEAFGAEPRQRAALPRLGAPSTMTIEGD
jgi:hypothetical protein